MALLISRSEARRSLMARKVSSSPPKVPTSMKPESSDARAVAMIGSANSGEDTTMVMDGSPTTSTFRDAEPREAGAERTGHSKATTVEPMRMRSPSTRGARVTTRSFTAKPLRDPRSSTQ